MATPKLRFKEFDYEYKNTSFEKLEGFSIQSGKSDNKEDIGDYPFYGSTGIIGYSGSYDYLDKAILIARVGANAGSLYQVDGKYSVSDNTLILRVSNLDNLNYIRELLIKFNLNRLVFGTGQPLVTGGMIKKVNISIPELKEQTKIASFLSAVDEKISQLTKKYELLSQYKQGMMQKLFSQQIRFKADDGSDFGEWKEKELSEIFQIKAGGDIDKESVSEIKSDEFCYPIFANSDKNKGFYGWANKFKYTEAVTVTGRGNLGIAVARNEPFYPIVRLLVLLPLIKQNLKFFEEQINLLDIVSESTGVPQLTAPQLSKYRINVPSLEEQTKIANFLSAIDQKIEVVAQQVEQAKLWKKGLLQQMFV